MALGSNSQFHLEADLGKPDLVNMGGKKKQGES